VIPDEAVEAAAKCFPGYDPDWEGDDLDRAENEAFRSRGLQILEAAAPHLMAQALTSAARAMELMPPMLRAQYVATLRLYASGPWRLRTIEAEALNE
jgi:hypothetical protein